MFHTSNTFRTANTLRTTTRRLALLAAPLALLAAAAPMLGAGPWYWYHQPRRAEVVVRVPPPVYVAPVPGVVCKDVIPADLRFSAYQAGDTVTVVVSGANNSAGYSTTLNSFDLSDSTPTLDLRNAPPVGVAGLLYSPFSFSASFRTRFALSALTVRIAGQSYQVPVVAAPALN